MKETEWRDCGFLYIFTILMKCNYLSEVWKLIRFLNHSYKQARPETRVGPGQDKKTALPPLQKFYMPFYRCIRYFICENVSVSHVKCISSFRKGPFKLRFFLKIVILRYVIHWQECRGRFAISVCNTYERIYEQKLFRVHTIAYARMSIVRENRIV